MTMKQPDKEKQRVDHFDNFSCEYHAFCATRTQSSKHQWKRGFNRTFGFWDLLATGHTHTNTLLVLQYKLKLTLCQHKQQHTAPQHTPVSTAPQYTPVSTNCHLHCSSCRMHGCYVCSYWSKDVQVEPKWECASVRFSDYLRPLKKTNTTPSVLKITVVQSGLFHGWKFQQMAGSCDSDKSTFHRFVKHLGTKLGHYSQITFCGWQQLCSICANFAIK